MKTSRYDLGGISTLLAFAPLHLMFVTLCLLVSIRAQASVPTNAVVEFRFAEGSGTSTTNEGSLGGLAVFDVSTNNTGYPRFTNNVPAGTYVPAGNSYSLDMGPTISTNGGRAVDLTTTASPPGDGTAGPYEPGLTVCGWVNANTLDVGSGGNRICYAFETPNALGFDVMQGPLGCLQFEANQYNGSPISSLGKITADPAMGAANWVFFAVTFDPNVSTQSVKWYFGRANKLASLDVANNYTNTTFGSHIDFTGQLTVGNFGVVEPQRPAIGTASRMYRGLIDQLRLYTNVLTIDQIQQAQLENSVVPQVAVTILTQPTNQIANSGSSASFTVEASGSGAIYYQWQTNGLAVPGATNVAFTMSGLTVTNSGTLVSVTVSNITNSVMVGVLSSNATLTVLPPPPVGQIILANADVAYNGVFGAGGVAINYWVQSVPQINWGLGASGGVATSGGRRAFVEFTLGTNPVASASFKIWNYWGGPAINGQGRLPQATTRLWGPTNALIHIVEPPPNTSTDQTWQPPTNTDFAQISADQLIPPNPSLVSTGWYAFDITAWYNSHLGQTNTLMMRAAASSGFDFPLYEDREGRAFDSGAGGSIPNGGPRIEYFLPPPTIQSVSVSGGQVRLSGYPGVTSSNFYVLVSTNVLLPMSNWTRVATNQFDAASRFNITNTLDPAIPVRFYRLQVP
jgi:hypothetical protein